LVRWRWNGVHLSARPILAPLETGRHTITVTVPSNAATVADLGVEFTTNASWSGTAYIDAITW
jgi:hypothetical protein